MNTFITSVRRHRAGKGLLNRQRRLLLFMGELVFQADAIKKLK